MLTDNFLTTDYDQTPGGFEAWVACDRCTFAARATERPDLQASAGSDGCRCPSCNRPTLKQHAWPEHVRFAASAAVNFRG